jgi:sporulation protein YlmC with PRC-barrel domain
VLALLAGPVAFTGAQAQTQAPPPSTHPLASSPSAPTATAPRTPMSDPMAQEDLSEVKGSAVFGSDDKKIGSVSTMLMDTKSKKLDRLVVSEGGVLGVGSHRVALPVDDFKWDGQKRGFKIGKTADDLKKMPEWSPTALREATGSTQ